MRNIGYILTNYSVKGYGEAEFVFAIIKITAVIGFIILGTIINIGGGPQGGYIGGKLWRDPGAFNNGFKGLCSVFVNAAFAFSGTELVGLAAAETANPRKSLPTAVKQVFWRISLFYIVSLTIVGLLVPYNDKRLLQTNDTASTVASPFVIAIQNAGIEGLPSVFNAVIMIAVLSVGNSSIYGSSRTLAALAEQHQAPKIFAYIDRQGRPLVSIAFASSLGLFAFLAGADRSLQKCCIQLASFSVCSVSHLHMALHLLSTHSLSARLEGAGAHSRRARLSVTAWYYWFICRSHIQLPCPCCSILHLGSSIWSGVVDNGRTPAALLPDISRASCHTGLLLPLQILVPYLNRAIA